MTKTPWIAGAALAATLAVSAFAMPPADGHPAPPKTRAELQARIAERFKQADTNGDGYVTTAERDAAREAMKAKWQEHRAERQEQRFAALDTDKNGALSKQEFLTRPDRDGPDRGDGERDGRGRGGGGHRGHHGDRMHGGGFGMGGGEWFEKADADKDGKLSLAEAQAGPLAMFDKADTNKDGTISPEEHKAARDAMRAKWQERREARDKQG